MCPIILAGHERPGIAHALVAGPMVGFVFAVEQEGVKLPFVIIQRQRARKRQTRRLRVPAIGGNQLGPGGGRKIRGDRQKQAQG